MGAPSSSQRVRPTRSCEVHSEAGRSPARHHRRRHALHAVRRQPQRQDLPAHAQPGVPRAEGASQPTCGVPLPVEPHQGLAADGHLPEGHAAGLPGRAIRPEQDRLRGHLPERVAAVVRRARRQGADREGAWPGVRDAVLQRVQPDPLRQRADRPDALGAGRHGEDAGPGRRAAEAAGLLRLQPAAQEPLDIPAVRPEARPGNADAAGSPRRLRGVPNEPAGQRGEPGAGLSGDAAGPQRAAAAPLPAWRVRRRQPERAVPRRGHRQVAPHRRRTAAVRARRRERGPQRGRRRRERQQR